MIFCNCLRNSDLYLLRKGVQKSFDVLFCEKRLRLNVDVFYPLCKDDINRVGVSERNEMANLILRACVFFCKRVYFVAAAS